MGYMESPISQMVSKDTEANQISQLNRAGTSEAKEGESAAVKIFTLGQQAPPFTFLTYRQPLYFQPTIELTDLYNSRLQYHIEHIFSLHDVASIWK